MRYNPDSPASQKALAQTLVGMLSDCGFMEEWPKGTKERVFSRAVSEDARVVVYTSVNRDRGPNPMDPGELRRSERQAVRGRGHDAIRVCLVRQCSDGRDRGLVKNKRVNRVGQVHDIVGRVKDRMRDTWKSYKTVKKCANCGAPKFVSKKGNLVCSEICWKSVS